jgi:hypothetical protein
MESLIAMNREANFDIKCRYAFCLYFYDAEQRVQNFQTVEIAIQGFLRHVCKQPFYEWFRVPFELSIQLQEWFAYLGTFPESCIEQRNPCRWRLDLPFPYQKHVMQCIQEHLKARYEFIIVNEDNDYTPAEQAAAREKLKSLVRLMKAGI